MQLSREYMRPSQSLSVVPGMSYFSLAFLPRPSLVAPVPWETGDTKTVFQYFFCLHKKSIYCLTGSWVKVRPVEAHSGAGICWAGGFVGLGGVDGIGGLIWEMSIHQKYNLSAR